MSNRPSSLEAAARDQLGDNAPADAAPVEEQISLFGGGADPKALDRMRDANGQLPANVFQLIRAGEADGPRKPGRPKGARNKRSDDLAKLIVHQHGDPVLFMASLYSTPLDQLAEMLLAADGTLDRQQRLDALIEVLAEKVGDLVQKSGLAGSVSESVQLLATATEQLAEASRRSQGKPGEVAIKALNVQLAAAKATAEYTHSKKPTEVQANVGVDGVLVMAGGGASDFEQKKAQAALAGDLIGKALSEGTIQLENLGGYRLHDGQLVHEAEFEEVADEGGEA